MSKLQFTFDHQKSTQALNYFAIQAGGQINKMKALKLIFLADRYHLRKYGRFITNDNYVAMEHGPVPSTTKDIAESNDYLEDIKKRYYEKYIKTVSNLELKSKKVANKDVFSESDLEALNFAWNTFGHYDQFQLRDITHTYPEWTKQKKYVTRGSCVAMNPLDFLQDPTEHVDDSLELDEKDHRTFELDDEYRHIRSEEITEKSFVESLWR